jgi:hypothetical protein
VELLLNLPQHLLLDLVVVTLAYMRVNLATDYVLLKTLRNFAQEHLVEVGVVTRVEKQWNVVKLKVILFAGFNPVTISKW